MTAKHADHTESEPWKQRTLCSLLKDKMLTSAINRTNSIVLYLRHTTQHGRHVDCNNRVFSLDCVPLYLATCITMCDLHYIYCLSVKTSI